MSIVRIFALVWMSAGVILHAHESGGKSSKPTKAQADLTSTRKKLDEAKKKLAAQGRYKCCVKPTCDLCARVNGSCNCAANVAAGKGSCGECYAGWVAGRGAVSGVKKDQISLLPAEQQKVPGEGEASPELMEAIEALDACETNACQREAVFLLHSRRMYAMCA